MYIADNIRSEDAEEIWASGLSKARDVIVRGIKDSDYVLAGYVKDDPVCIWGVVREDLLFNQGIPWMLGTSALNDNRKAWAFLRKCRKPVLSMMENYDRLENYVDARNVRSQRWLRYMGFTLEEPKPYGALELPFHKFWMES